MDLNYLRAKGNQMKKFLLATLAAVLVVLPVLGESTWDSERLNLEVRMQQRVEEALSKILPAGQFVVVIRIEPWVKSIDNPEKAEPQDGFFLPGVPNKTKLDRSDEEMKDAISSLKVDKTIFQKFIRRIAVTLVLDQDIAEDVVGKVRELTRQMLGLDPGRGDTLDIQRTVFQKPVVEKIDNSSLSRFQRSLQSYWLIISLALIVFCITVFLLFVFGPLRGFLNRFVTTMASMKPADGGDGKIPRFGQNDPQILPGMMAQAMGLLPSGGGYGGGGGPANFSGSLQVENPNKRVMPFGFIREDHLGNLPILLARETPERAAVVLGYLPPDWISRVLSKMERSFQSQVTDQLATTRQLLPEQVEDIEQDLKRRLDYMIGGPDRIIAVYESLDPEAQKRMLDTLKESRPDIAEELRQRTLLFEDLEKLETPSLKAVLREVDLQTLVVSLKGTPEGFRNRIMENISQGKAEIIKEELDLSDTKPGKATLEAQRKITLLARRLEREGQIQIPLVDGSAPPSRYGASLRSTIKLPPGMTPGGKSNENDTIRAQDAQVVDTNGGIEEKIRRFMSRRAVDKERFPTGEDTTRGPKETE